MANILNNIKDRQIIKPFDDYGDLLELLTYYKDNLEELIGMRQRIRNYAHKNLIWEKNEPKILEVYSSP
jgi:Mg2+/Co2+ transporter CorB